MLKNSLHIERGHETQGKKLNKRLNVKQASFKSALLFLLAAAPVGIYAQVSVQNYPNPFTNTTVIEYTLPAQMRVVVKACEQNGKVINTILDTVQPSGKYNINSSGLLDNLMVMSEDAYLYVLLKKENDLNISTITDKVVMRK